MSLALQDTLYTSRNPTRRWLHVTRRERIEATLRRLAAERQLTRALEVGPGSGVYLPVLCALVDEVVAGDVEQAFLERARELARQYPNLQVVQDDVTRTQFAPESFDLVVCSEVLEHIPAAEAGLALQSIRRILRPGGLLLISTPQRHSPLEVASKVAFLPGILQLVRTVYREPILPTGHVNLMSDRKARSLLAATGFHVRQSCYSGVYLPLIAEFGGDRGLSLAKRVERRLVGGPFQGLLWTQYHVAVRQ